MKLEATMDVSTIVILLIAFIAALAVVAHMVDNWRDNDDYDDWEPYG
jgi:hypothetical protein